VLGSRIFGILCGFFSFSNHSSRPGTTLLDAALLADCPFLPFRATAVQRDSG
jgi:hypothetical protein